MTTPARKISQRNSRRQERHSKPPGELAFEAYLSDRRMRAQYHPRLSGTTKRPDYLLTASPRPIVCEVTDLSVSPGDRKARADVERHTLRRGRITVVPAGAVSIDAMAERIAANIEEELPQLAPFRRDHPCVVVLHIPPASDVLVSPDPDIVLEALRLVLDRRSPDSFSAVAVLETRDVGAQDYEPAIQRALHEILHDRQGAGRPGYDRRRLPQLTYDEISLGVDSAYRRMGPRTRGLASVMTTYHNPTAPLQRVARGAPL